MFAPPHSTPPVSIMSHLGLPTVAAITKPLISSDYSDQRTLNWMVRAPLTDPLSLEALAMSCVHRLVHHKSEALSFHLVAVHLKHTNYPKALREYCDSRGWVLVPQARFADFLKGLPIHDGWLLGDTLALPPPDTQAFTQTMDDSPLSQERSPTPEAKSPVERDSAKGLVVPPAPAKRRRLPAVITTQDSPPGNATTTMQDKWSKDACVLYSTMSDHQLSAYMMELWNHKCIQLDLVREQLGMANQELESRPTKRALTEAQLKAMLKVINTVNID